MIDIYILACMLKNDVSNVGTFKAGIYNTISICKWRKLYMFMKKSPHFNNK